MLPDTTVVKTVLTGVAQVEVTATSLGVVVRVPHEDTAAVLSALKSSDLGFVMLVDLLGTDTDEDVELTYHLRSFARDEELYVKCSLPYDGVLHSVWNVYASALLPERETAELFGLTLAGHPNPARLLTTDGEEPLLRRSVPIRTLKEVRDR
ncbi:MAG: NADH-quinone oxidoreductase subunit C [Coriobacteriia bacterium]|nr:NADH-quinone oxidoreductase subunit C [Coriobacteriia bacterium]